MCNLFREDVLAVLLMSVGENLINRTIPEVLECFKKREMMLSAVKQLFTCISALQNFNTGFHGLLSLTIHCSSPPMKCKNSFSYCIKNFNHYEGSKGPKVRVVRDWEP